MNVVPFSTGVSTEEAVRVLDTLRADIVSGEIVAFCAVGIKRDDGTAMWLANVAKAKTNLQMMGAVANLLMHYWNGDIK